MPRGEVLAWDTSQDKKVKIEHIDYNAMHDLNDPDTHTHWRLLPTQHPWTTTQPTKGLLGTRTRCALDMTPAQGRCCVAGHPPPSTHPHTIHNTTRASVVNTTHATVVNTTLNTDCIDNAVVHWVSCDIFRQVGGSCAS